MTKNAEDTVVIAFTDCDAGWVDFTVSCGTQSVAIRASHVFDPFPDLLAWLEAIAVGVQECAFEIDEEGTCKRLEYRRISYDSFRFTIKDNGELPPGMLQGQVAPLQLVREFYDKLRMFAQSPEYRKDQWETETLGERFANLSTPPHKPSLMMRYLLTLDRSKLRATFFKLAPSYWITFPEAANKDEELRRFVEHTFDPENPEKQKGLVKAPEEWGIPEDYDTWPRQKKVKFITERLSEDVSSFGGTKLGSIKSRIIEDLIRRETKNRKQALKRHEIATPAQAVSKE